MRTPEDIRAELRSAVNRRVAGRDRISILSQCIVADTRLIDRLLGELADLNNAVTTTMEARSGR